jgi:hypothetical protein
MGFSSSKVYLPTWNRYRFHGGVHRVVYRNYHRALAKRFPFAIFYAVSGDTAFVHAVVDRRRKPVWITKQIQ